MKKPAALLQSFHSATKPSFLQLALCEMGGGEGGWRGGEEREREKPGHSCQSKRYSFKVAAVVPVFKVDPLI